MAELILDDSTPSSVLFPRTHARGAIPRDYATDPVEMFAPPTDMPLIPRSEWSARIKEQKENKSRLSDVRNRGNNGSAVPSLDQGQVGYCWAHSTTHATMIVRMLMGLPYVPLSAYAVAATIKNGRDEGGWCGLSAKFLREKGVPAQSFWPQGDRNYAKYQSNQAVWDNAKLHRTTEDWVDLTRQVYDQSLTFDQLATCLLMGTPCAVDLNWWGHSVCALDLEEVEPNSFGIRIWNSWGDGWSENGTGILRGNKAVPDGAVALRVVPAAAA